MLDKKSKTVLPKLAKAGKAANNIKPTIPINKGRLW